MHTEGPLLIHAGAGAGKTKTITHRIANLIARGNPPHRILAVTFTNKAAGEMRARIRDLLQGRSSMPLVTTFHSLGVRLLREFHETARIPRTFTIWDRDDSIKALKNILDRLDMEESAARGYLSAISREKSNGIRMKEYCDKAQTYRERTVAQVWEAYEMATREEDALDFDDLLLRTLSLLQESDRVRTLLQNRFSHITIDEYQDTNGVQYEIARLLAGEKKNICVVGDIDQNIYSWRGARIEHLLQFEDTFPGTTVVRLEQNYRSTRTILAAANAVIKKNLRRKEKNLFTENPTGEPLMIYGARNEIDEAWFVARVAEHLIENGTRPGEIAVLYRENFQSRVLEEAFLNFSVPYRVVGTRFFERKEVKDTLSYLRAALNPKSKTDIARIIAVPPRGIGKTTLIKMLQGGEASLPAGVRAKIAAFRELLAKIKYAAETLPPFEAIRFTLEASGMEAMLKNDTEEGIERLENVRELVNLATRYSDLPPREGIEKLLEEAALQSDQDEIEDVRSSVSLMTVHAAKGLEFDCVFVTGLEQGLFPSIRQASEGERDEEEERRLFYVALTRAKRLLYLSYASERAKWGQRERTMPSEFFEDIDPRLTAPASLENTTEKTIELL
ncbi:MAG: ATP-dependent DNA helicase PcrA [Candidatus Kaiserbacteria bacterium GW2011_GWC2_52_8b]|uniref:DNA 3'-5' helicase n=3 Tax=Candidatus Kaiseribacteriota TaxID=1752734 RepID=A0A0G1XGL6_9BACT|nr:MAG: ATP-dependent DNA helicase PcrA [Candidatus Kaiserbacteria bacterium GW2011_GWA2_52_12]KKW30050.1 MAG: ATP-dependent DNA helicase PcrA [Candidatus Kaiserbacteria bacterium GW2011_GWC2_52_8b]